LDPTQTQLRPIWSQKFPKNKENKEKIDKGFARFSQNLLNFCRPHLTSVVVANFCGYIFCDPCSNKNIKNSEKIQNLDAY